VKYPNQKFEETLHQEGYWHIAGVDEVGVGSLAGPVLAAAVILPRKTRITGIKDSKKLSAQQRNILFKEIEMEAIAIGVGIVDEKIIDEINILKASQLAMKIAIESLEIKPEYLLIDGRNKIEIDLPQQPIIKGDNKCISIAAASIIAKVIRDKIMDNFSLSLATYGFQKNKGYGTQSHLAALLKYGPSPIHRQSYAPVISSLKTS